MHVPESIASAIPYLEAQRARWSPDSKNELSLILPEGVSLSAFVSILKQMLLKQVQALSKTSDVQSLLHEYQLASMLGCDSLTLEIQEKLRDAIRTPKDVDTVLEFCNKHLEPTVGLADLAEKLRSRKPLTDPEKKAEIECIKAGIEKALKDQSTEQMETIAKMLKQRSRSEGTAVDEVGQLFADGVRVSIKVKNIDTNVQWQFCTWCQTKSSDVHTEPSCGHACSVMQNASQVTGYKTYYTEFGVKLLEMATQFVSARSQWFTKIAEVILIPIAKGAWDQTSSMNTILNDAFTSLFHIGSAHVIRGDLDAKKFLPIFERALSTTPWMTSAFSTSPDSLQFFGTSVEPLEASIQTDLVHILSKLSDEFFNVLIHERFITHLSMHARIRFYERLLKVDVQLMKTTATIPVLQCFNEAHQRAIAVRLLPILMEFPEDLRLELSQLFRGLQARRAAGDVVNEDSDDGF